MPTLDTPKAIRERRYTKARSQRARDTRQCWRCHQAIEENRSRAITCQACADKVQRWNRQSGLEVERPYAGGAICRDESCGKTFYSQDRRRITRCPKHQAKIFRAEELLPCEEARYDTEERSEGNAYRMLQSKFNGRQINSQDHKDIRLAEMREAYKGIKFRRLTEQEIAEYTPERIAGILDRAARNFQANVLIPEMRSL